MTTDYIEKTFSSALKFEESNTNGRKNKMIIKKQSFLDFYTFKTQKAIRSMTTDYFQKTWGKKFWIAS